MIQGIKELDKQVAYATETRTEEHDCGVFGLRQEQAEQVLQPQDVQSHGVIAMIDALVGDLEKEVQEIEFDEKDAQW